MHSATYDALPADVKADLGVNVVLDDAIPVGEVRMAAPTFVTMNRKARRAQAARRRQSAKARSK